MVRNVLCMGMALLRVVVVKCNNYINYATSLDLTDVSSFDRAKFWVNELRASEEVSIAAILVHTSAHICAYHTTCTHCWTHPLQDCLVYLCGTKYDLVQEDKKARKVEASTVERYGDGKAILV